MNIYLPRRRFLTLIGTGILGILGYSTAFEPKNLKITKIKLNFKSLPTKLDGLVIAHITDLHFGSTLCSEIYKKVLEVVKKENSDIIAVTGDIISKRSVVDKAKEFFNQLPDKPTFIVWGNWDHWSMDKEIKKFKESLENKKTRVLVNDYYELEENFFICGVDDPHTSRDNINNAVRKTGFKILLAHSPEIMGKAENRVELVLAGHTHGGQVVIPFIGAPFVPVTKKYRRYASGIFKVGKTILFVSRGIGTSIFPVRMNCPPEIAFIELGKNKI